MPPALSQPQAIQHACAECKRLKLKCSKTIPCDRCTHRGCESICPNGTLKPGRGTRLILSNTEDLHDEIQRLRGRVKELEAALADLRAQVATEPHPLLKDSLVPLPSSTSAKSPEDDEEVLIDTFGSLTIEPDGSSEWFGRHGVSEFFVGPEDRPKPPPKGQTPPHLPVELVFLSKMFPFKTTYSVDDEVRRHVRARLPSREVAWGLAHQYYGHIAWTTNPVHQTEFFDHAMDPVYGDTEARDEQVALVFAVLALGTVLDLRKQAFHLQALDYIHLARVSLVLGEDLLQSRSLVVIQTLNLIAFYYQISHDPTGPSKSWMLTAMAVRMAQGAGLHRDSDRWDKFPAEAKRRRRLWWEISRSEFMVCFQMGRPRMINPTQCDTKMPKDAEDTGGAPSWDRIKFKWIEECLGPFSDAAHALKPPSYSQILKLDRTMRDYPLREATDMNDIPLSDGTRIMLMLMRAFSTNGTREIALLYLHRTYLVETLIRWPEDPLRGKFALSVLAAHRSSLLIIQGLGRLHNQLTDLVPRIAIPYQDAFSAYVCLCAIVIRSPGCALARSALNEIDRAKGLFIGANTYRVTKAMGVIEKLHTQAHAAYDAFRNGWWPPRRSQMSSGDNSVVDNEYVLRFAGAPGIVGAAASEQHLAQERTTKAPIQPPEGVHPTLFEYLKAFREAGITTDLPQGHGIAGNFRNSDVLNPYQFQPLHIAQQASAGPDLALFRPTIPPVWSTDESDSTSYTQRTSYTSPLYDASSSTGPGLQSVASGTEPLGSPRLLNEIDDIRKLYHMDMDALMRAVPVESPASASMEGLTNSQLNPSPPFASNVPSINDPSLDWDSIFAMYAPSMDTAVPEQGWENFLTNNGLS